MRELEKKHETNVLVSLMEKHEYRGYQIPELLEKDSFGGIEILRFAIKDMGVPREAESERFEAFVQKVVQRLEQGQNIVVHCRGGLGRTGTLAACMLVALGHHSADEAIDAVLAARKDTVQTREQEGSSHCLLSRVAPDFFCCASIVWPITRGTRVFIPLPHILLHFHR